MIAIQKTIKKPRRVVEVIDICCDLSFKRKNKKVLLMVRFQLDILTKSKKEFFVQRLYFLFGEKIICIHFPHVAHLF